MLINALCAHLAEFGVIAPQGLRHVEQLVAGIEKNHVGLPELARSILRLIVAQLNDTQGVSEVSVYRLLKAHDLAPTQTARRGRPSFDFL